MSDLCASEVVESLKDFDRLIFKPLKEQAKAGRRASLDTETTWVDQKRGFNPFYGTRAAMIQFSWNDVGPDDEIIERNYAVNIRMRPGITAKPKRPSKRTESMAFTEAWKVFAGANEDVGTWDLKDLPESLELPPIERPKNANVQGVIKRMNQLTKLGIVWVLKNMKFDLLMLLADDFVMPPVEQLEDVEVKSHLTEQNPWQQGRRVSHKLQDLAERHLGREALGELGLAKWFEAMGIKSSLRCYDAVPYKSVLGPYGCQDTRDTLDLDDFFDVKMARLDANAKKKLRDLYDEEILLIWNLVQDTIVPGLPVDQAVADTLLEHHAKLRDQYAGELYQMTGSTIDWRSGEELASFLFDAEAEGGCGYKLPEFGMTKTGRSTSEAVLKTIGTPLTELILRWRRANTFVVTFLEPIARFNIDGAVHPDFHLTGVRTGRLSCSHPNMQNRPKDKDVRSMFIPPKGYAIFAPDYDQVEMRVAGHYAYLVCENFPRVDYREWNRWRVSKAPPEVGLWEGFTKVEGYDPHQIMADLSGLPRRREQTGMITCKEVNFGLLYGIGLNGMCREYGWLKSKSKEIRDIWYQAYPEIRHLRAFILQQLEQKGFITNEFGRRYYIDTNKAYLALNYLIQGCCGDLIKRAMNRVYALARSLQEATEGPPPLRLLNTVHDELLLGIREDLDWMSICQAVNHEMTYWERGGKPLFQIPITAGWAKSEQSWGHVEDFDLAA